MGRKRQPGQLTGKPVFIGYARVSTEDQATSGLSLADQVAKLQAWAVYEGVELREVVTETVSGAVAHDKRPRLASALKALRSREVAGLVVVKLDRLGRSVSDTLDFMDETRRKGYRFISLGERLDTTDATSALLLTIVAAMAEWERKIISERTTAALRQRRLANKHSSNKLPYGWRLEGDTTTVVVHAGETRPLVPYPPEKAVLDRLEALQSKGMGSHRIASTLNKRGERNPRTGGEWKPGTVAAILATAARRRG